MLTLVLGVGVFALLRQKISISLEIFNPGGQEWPEYGWRTQMDQNGPKSGQNGPKWTILVHFGPFWPEIQFGIKGQNGPKWSERPFWTILVQSWLSLAGSFKEKNDRKMTRTWLIRTVLVSQYRGHSLGGRSWIFSIFGGPLGLGVSSVFSSTVLRIRPPCTGVKHPRIQQCTYGVVSRGVLAETSRKFAKIRFIRAARVQNEFAPEKILNRYEKRFEKREKGSEKRSETRLKNV